MADDGGKDEARQRALSVRVPDDVHRRLKIALATRGETMQEMLERAIRRYIEDPPR